MEAEGLHLPDEPVQLAIREPWGAGSHERPLQALEVIEQLVRLRIGEREIPPPGGCDAIGNDQQELPERLAGGM